MGLACPRARDLLAGSVVSGDQEVRRRAQGQRRQIALKWHRNAAKKSAYGDFMCQVGVNYGLREKASQRAKKRIWKAF